MTHVSKKNQGDRVQRIFEYYHNLNNVFKRFSPGSMLPKNVQVDGIKGADFKFDPRHYIQGVVIKKWLLKTLALP